MLGAARAYSPQSVPTSLRAAPFERRDRPCARLHVRDLRLASWPASANCGHAAQMRDEIAMLRRARARRTNEILAAFVEKYGSQEPLRRAAR